MIQRNARAQTPSGALRRDDGIASSEGRGTGGLLDPRLLPPSQAGSAPVDTAVVGEQYLVFTLLEQELAILAEHIQGVERLADVTPVPNVASWVKGVINLRGSIASVVDLRAFLGMEEIPLNPRTRLLSIKFNEMVVCIVVDSVSEMTPIASSAIIDQHRQAGVPSWLTPYAAGSVFIGKRHIVLLDASRLLFSEKMQHYS